MAWWAAAWTAAVGLFLLRPAVPTDDAYASIDWGHQLLGGSVPALEGRTFHPFLVAVGALVSVFGGAAPALTVLLSLVAFLSLAAAGWRIVRCLGFPQPAPALASVLLLASPLLVVLAFVAFDDAAFAVAVLWAIVFALEERPARAWVLLGIAGLIRPEGWAFAAAYGLLLWASGSSRNARSLAGVVAIALVPAGTWLALEALLFGDPLYSFHHLAGSASSAMNGVRNLEFEIRGAINFVVVGFAGLGVIAVATLAPRRPARVFLTLSAVAVLSCATLVLLGFPFPSRHLAPVAGLTVVLAAVGAVAPAQAIARRRPQTSTLPIAALAVLGAVGVGTAEIARSVRSYPRFYRTIGVTRTSVMALDRALAEAAPLRIGTAAGPRTVAILGTSQLPELAWAIGVPFDVATTGVARSTRIVVEPTTATWETLRGLRLTTRPLWVPTAGWRQVGRGGWRVYIRLNSTRVRANTGV